MKIGFFAIGAGRFAQPELVKTIAIHTERLGFSTLWAPEHVVLMDQYASKYPYSGGKFPVVVDTAWTDPFVTLGYAAAYTARIRLATGICLVPEHNPVVLAKVVATLDQLSSGRFVLGAGIGWLAEEFKALGISFERRAQRTREYIEAMRVLWRDSVSTYQGEFVSFGEVRSYPKPVHGEVPVWFGGESGPALRRVAEYGNGWCGFSLSPDEAAAKISRIEELLKNYGRKRSDVELAVSAYAKPITPDDLKRYRDAGADELVLVEFKAPSKESDMVKRLEQMARDWVEPAARL